INTFPALPNEGAVLFLKSPSYKIIHTVSYSDKWYNNPVKKIGGYSLEMVDSKNPCSGKTNWTASDNISGGTPGKLNSNHRVNIDESQPRIKKVYAADSVTIFIYFSEPIDSIMASSILNYNIENINIESITVIEPVFNVVKLRLTNSLEISKVYTLSCNNIFDCAGNVVDRSKIKFGLHEIANSSDIVINEILFNPNLAGIDFVEIYNRGSKLLDLKNIYIANKATDGSINTPIQISLEGQTFYPGEFIVLSRDEEIVKREYITMNPDCFLDISLPAFNDDKGSVVILNSSGEILDEINYTEKWHFPLVVNAEGVSLERIHYQGSSDNKEYWTSASKSSGYATPSYKNSQFLAGTESGGDVNVSPKIISPDNDGRDDFAIIEYKFKEPGMLCTIIIFDASGRAVRYLQRNVLAGKEGSFKWDGLGEKLRKLPSGIYIVYTEAMSLKGKIERYKNAIVLADR
ncbi:MAG: lamin tail domain-containing protein, partial [Ferruginibacter sp.]